MPQISADDASIPSKAPEVRRNAVRLLNLKGERKPITFGPTFETSSAHTRTNWLPTASPKVKPGVAKQGAHAPLALRQQICATRFPGPMHGRAAVSPVLGQLGLRDAAAHLHAKMKHDVNTSCSATSAASCQQHLASCWQRNRADEGYQPVWPICRWPRPPEIRTKTFLPMDIWSKFCWHAKHGRFQAQQSAGIALRPADAVGAVAKETHRRGNST